MYISATQFNLEHSALEIYISGCDFHCKNCHNPELWEFEVGEPAINYLPRIIYKANESGNLVKRIWFLGGEPLHQGSLFPQYVSVLRSQIKDKEFWLWTGYEYAELSKQIKELFDYFKCGKYDEKLLTENLFYEEKDLKIKLSSSNQYIIKKEK